MNSFSKNLSHKRNGTITNKLIDWGSKYGTSNGNEIKTTNQTRLQNY